MCRVNSILLADENTALVGVCGQALGDGVVEEQGELHHGHNESKDIRHLVRIDGTI